MTTNQGLSELQQKEYSPKMTINLTNNEFLTALFGDNAGFAHVTDFNYDPDCIPDDRHLFAWKGDYFSKYAFKQQSNQYFTISIFNPDEHGTARRRKALYMYTPVIVLDDVKEKLNMTEVEKLPQPSWILETSKGSEQWGYILSEPCSDRHRVENLLDGLVANGLAPDGRDPGMKGVTRYVRLPEGYNLKAKRYIDGQPFKCQITHWQPEQKVTLEQLAEPFAVNLEHVRREARVDGASDVSDHPIINVPDVIHVKEIRSDGRFDITCPWTDEHTGGVDNGAAVFTNEDFTIGFKCHHGACQHRTGKDLLTYIDGEQSGFKNDFANWKVLKSFAPSTAVALPETKMNFDFLSGDVVNPDTPAEPVVTADPLANVFAELQRQIPSSAEAREMSGKLLKVVEEFEAMDRLQWHTDIRDVMKWSKPEFNEILKSLRSDWYDASKVEFSFYEDVVYIGELNQFYNRTKGIFYTPDAYQNNYAHLDADAKKEALQGGRVMKVDKLDYAPKQTPVFIERGVTFCNSWIDLGDIPGVAGDVSTWLNHFDQLGWSEYREHIVQWMAYTIRFPENKINHMIIMGSGEGSGKDWLLTPLTKAMTGHTRSISGEELLSNFNDYVMGVKYLNINETELGDRKEALAVSAKLKPLATAPPNTLRVNQKGIKAIDVRNIVNSIMTTNSDLPVRLTGPSRRFLALWSELNPRDSTGNVSPVWAAYWRTAWDWMKNGGDDAVIHYLRNVVDLSTFNPAEPPPVTQFLRDILETSKTPAHQTVEAFINNKIGLFNSDILSAEDVSNVLRSGDVFAAGYMYADAKQFTPVRCGQLLKGVVTAKRLRAGNAHTSKRLWVIRDVHKYEAMTAGELLIQYETQIKASRSATVIGVAS
jgi:hypothetical protein